MGRSLGFRQLGRALLKHNIPTMAAGVTLFILIALFPTVAVLFSLYGKYGDTITLSKGLDQVSAFLPDGGVTLLKAELTRLARGGHRALDWSFLINLMIALWSTSGAYTALAAGLNSAYQLRERRSFMRLTLEGIFFAAIAIGAMIVAAVLLPPSLSAESHSAVLKLC
jgi:membrane protein